jgi:5-methylcytosine-specific restriction protein A
VPTRPPSHAELLRRARGRGDADRAYDVYRRDRDPALAAAARVYRSNRWRQVRALQLTREPLCEDCRRHGVVEPATQVDHVLGLVDRPDLAYDLSNCQSLCTPCHARKSAAERLARRGRRLP